PQNLQPEPMFKKRPLFRKVRHVHGTSPLLSGFVLAVRSICPREGRQNGGKPGPGRTRHRCRLTSVTSSSTDPSSPNGAKDASYARTPAVFAFAAARFRSVRTASPFKYRTLKPSAPD